MMPADFKLTLLDNALDYVLSAAEYARRNDPRSWKYCVLHLFAGLELLLKERLRIHHWSLLFADPKTASQEALQAAEFKSVDFASCCGRLKTVLMINIDEKDLKHLHSLRRLRNRLQHFDVDLKLIQVKSQLAFGINFVIDFCRDQLSAVSVQARPVLEQIHAELANYSEFISERLERIGPQIQGKATWYCPQCSQETLVLGEGDPECRFCGFTNDAVSVFFQATAGDVIGNCPECGMPCADCGPFWRCFGCGRDFTDRLQADDQVPTNAEGEA